MPVLQAGNQEILTREDFASIDVAAIYNDLGPKYEHYILVDAGRKQCLDMVLDHLKTTAQPEIVDIGCASGRPVVEYLSQAGCNVTGVDLSPGQIEAARANIPQAKFVVQDIRTWEPETLLDGIVTFYALPHLPPDDCVALLGKMHGWLKADGILALGMVKGVNGRVKWMGHDLCGFSKTLGELEGMVVDAGFKIVRAWEEQWQSEGNPEAAWKVNQFVVAVNV